MWVCVHCDHSSSWFGLVYIGGWLLPAPDGACVECLVPLLFVCAFTRNDTVIFWAERGRKCAGSFLIGQNF